MEEITEGVNNIAIAGAGDTQKKNRIQVSNTKKPLFFYVNLAKVFTLFSYGFFEFVFLSTNCWCDESNFNFVDLKLGEFYCVQRYMQQHNEVELSALGMGISRLIYFVVYVRCEDCVHFASASFLLSSKFSIFICWGLMLEALRYRLKYWVRFWFGYYDVNILSVPFGKYCFTFCCIVNIIIYTPVTNIRSFSSWTLSLSFISSYYWSLMLLDLQQPIFYFSILILSNHSFLKTCVNSITFQYALSYAARSLSFLLLQLSRQEVHWTSWSMLRCC